MRRRWTEGSGMHSTERTPPKACGVSPLGYVWMRNFQTAATKTSSKRMPGLSLARAERAETPACWPAPAAPAGTAV